MMDDDIGENGLGVLIIGGNLTEHASQPLWNVAVPVILAVHAPATELLLGCSANLCVIER